MRYRLFTQEYQNSQKSSRGNTSMEQVREDGPYHKRVQGRTLLQEGEKVSMGRKDTS